MGKQRSEAALEALRAPETFGLLADSRVQAILALPEHVPEQELTYEGDRFGVMEVTDTYAVQANALFEACEAIEEHVPTKRNRFFHRGEVTMPTVKLDSARPYTMRRSTTESNTQYALERADDPEKGFFLIRDELGRVTLLKSSEGEDPIALDDPEVAIRLIQAGNLLREYAMLSCVESPAIAKPAPSPKELTLVESLRQKAEAELTKEAQPQVDKILATMKEQPMTKTWRIYRYGISSHQTPEERAVSLRVIDQLQSSGLYVNVLDGGILDISLDPPAET